MCFNDEIGNRRQKDGNCTWLEVFGGIKQENTTAYAIDGWFVHSISVVSK